MRAESPVSEGAFDIEVKFSPHGCSESFSFGMSAGSFRA